MPVRNAGAYLRPAVLSILAQEAVLLELILINDGSSDSAINNLTAQLNDPRLRVTQNRGVGLVDALNTGLDEAHGQFIARMDADDIAHPKRLICQQHYLDRHPDISICGCQVDIFSDDEIGMGYLLYQRWINSLQSHAEITRDFFVESPIPHPSAMIRRSVLDQLGGYQDNGWPEDYDLWCRALLAGARFGKPAAPSLLRWRDYPDRTSRIDESYSKKAFLACKAHYLAAYLTAHKVNCVALWGTGPTGLRLCTLLEQARFNVSEFYDVNVRMKGRRKRGLPVWVCPADTPDEWTRAKLNQFKHPQNRLIVAVSARGARPKMRDYLLAAGLEEQQDFLFAA